MAMAGGGAGFLFPRRNLDSAPMPHLDDFDEEADRAYLPIQVRTN